MDFRELARVVPFGHSLSLRFGEEANADEIIVVEYEKWGGAKVTTTTIAFALMQLDAGEFVKLMERKLWKAEEDNERKLGKVPR